MSYPSGQIALFLIVSQLRRIGRGDVREVGRRTYTVYRYLNPALWVGPRLKAAEGNCHRISQELQWKPELIPHVCMFYSLCTLLYIRYEPGTFVECHPTICC